MTYTKSGLILTGLTVTLVGLLGVFGYIPFLAAVAPLPACQNCTVVLTSLTCTIASCTVQPTISPATYTGTTDSTGTLNVPGVSFTVGTGVGATGCLFTSLSPVYQITVNGIQTGYSIQPGATISTSCGVNNPGSLTATAVVNGPTVTQVVINLLTGTTTTMSSTTTSSSSSSTTTTTTTTTTSCTVNCPPPAKGVPILAYIITLAGAGITVVGIRKKEAD